jgi:peptide/nickel transport system permease protein
VVPEVDANSIPGAVTSRAGSPFDHRAVGLLRWPSVRVAGRRLVLAVPLLFVVSALTFVLVSATPGDAAHEILGSQAPPEAYPKLRHALGLDLPLYEQYWHWVQRSLHGDLGASLFTNENVTHAIQVRLPVTLSLIIGSLLVSIVVGVSLGILSAVRGGAIGRAVDGLSLVGFALPAFWIGYELIYLFAVKFGWFPATGYVPFGQSPAAWLHSLVLPVVALSLYGIAVVTKQTREAMLDVLASEYIRMAWANGIPARSIYFRHALKNAAMRIATVIGVLAVGLLGGTVFVETVFDLPGLGYLAVNASVQHDLPVIQGIAVYFTLIVIAINLLIDLVYTWLNPKVRTR